MPKPKELCSKCNRYRLKLDDDGICNYCHRGQSLSKTLSFGSEKSPAFPCKKCGTFVTYEVAQESFRNGLCPVCYQKDKLAENKLQLVMGDLYNQLLSAVTLTPVEEETLNKFLKSDTVGTKALSKAQIVEVLYRNAAGQTAPEIAKHFKKAYGLGVSPITLNMQYLCNPEIRHIVVRLRREFKEAVNIIPIVNPMTTAFRLEMLYRSAEREKNRRDCIDILKTAWSVLGDKRTDSGDGSVQINLVQIINKISEKNQAERSARLAIPVVNNEIIEETNGNHRFAAVARTTD